MIKRRQPATLRCCEVMVDGKTVVGALLFANRRVIVLLNNYMSECLGPLRAKAFRHVIVQQHDNPSIREEQGTHDRLAVNHDLAASKGGWLSSLDHRFRDV